MTQRSVIIDTNLLVLLVVGLASPGDISQHKRLSKYEYEDFVLAKDVFLKFQRILFLPHVLTETSNLLSQSDRRRKETYLNQLKAMILHFGEHAQPSEVGMSDAAYLQLGLTDAMILTAGDRHHPILTDDLDLAVAARQRAIEVINLNHMRSGR